MKNKNGNKEHLKGLKAELKDCEQVRDEAAEKMADLEKLASERDEFRDNFLRLSADYDNARKRMDREKTDVIKYANEGLIAELFPILDSFDSAISSISQTEKDRPFLDGLKLLQDKFHKVLEDNGLAVMKSVGEKFDPMKHEALMKVNSDIYGDGIVAEELRKGYMLGDRVLRPAMVKVSIKEEPAPPSAAQDEIKKDENNNNKLP